MSEHGKYMRNICKIGRHNERLICEDRFGG